MKKERELKVTFIDSGKPIEKHHLLALAEMAAEYVKKHPVEYQEWLLAKKDSEKK